MSETAAARAVDLSKVYGKGEAEVAALDGVIVDFARRRVHRHHGTVRLRQVDAHALHGGARHADLAARSSSATSTCPRLNDKTLTALRRDRVGFVFQAFNLVPTLTARENICCRSSIAGRKPDPDWFDTVIDTVGLRDRLEPPARRAVRRPAAAGGAVPARWSAGPRSCSPTSRPATSTRPSGAEVLGFLRRSVRRVRPDDRDGDPRPGRRAYTDRVVFLADGQVVDEMRDPDRRRRARAA